MKNLLITLSLCLFIAGAISLNSCSKAGETADDSVSAKDNNSISNAINATSDDAAAAAGQVKSFSGKTDGWWNSAVLCGVTLVDTVGAGPGKISITYDGSTTCNGVIRSGTITVQNNSGIRWNTAGSQLTITITNLKVTDPRTLGSFTINGTHTITNKTGGLAWEVVAQLVPSGTTVTHRNQSSNMTITFADGSQRSWNVDRDRSWNLTGSTVTVTLSSENTNNEDSWGTNRYGTAFTNQITENISANNNNLSCIWRPYTGKIVHKIANRAVTVTFGTDASGTPMGSPTTCADGYYITYTRGNKTAYAFVPYWL
jgi:hypothetical protein